jgi:uncharacterized protein YndB with AHSA1/START domain
MTTETSTSVRVTRSFRASPERVFDAWLEPEKIAKWMLAPASGEIVRVDVDARLGGSFNFVVRRDGEDVAHVGEYLELDRPRRLVFTWGVPRYAAQVSRVSLDLVAVGSGTELTLTHERVLVDYASRTQTGWATILGAVAAALGEPA